jgi:hypothetical protein
LSSVGRECLDYLTMLKGATILKHQLTELR